MAAAKGKKVIIVGAGPGGLTSAMMLAHKGYDVTLYEKQSYIGGRNGAFSMDGFTFDYGPTFFLMKDILEEVFEFCGRKLDECVELMEIEPMYRLMYKGGKTFFPYRNREKMKEEMDKSFPGGFDGFDRYIRKEQKKYDTLIPCLQIPYSSVFDLFSWQLIRSLPYLHAHRSLYGHLGRFYKDPDLRIAFTFQAKYIGMSPWEAPGTFSIISFIEHQDGIFHVKGGLNQLSHAMAKSAEEDGAKIHTGRAVRRIIVENKVAIGVELEDGSIEKADHVIINADFAHAMGSLVDTKDRKKYTDKKLSKMKYSCSTFMLYLGLDKVYDYPHHNIIFADDYKKNVNEIVKKQVLSEDPSIYIQNASLIDPTLAPKGKSALYVLVPVPNNASGIDWAKETPAFREKILQYMDKKAGFTDIASHIVQEKVITPADWEHEKDVYLGATFNLGHNVGQMLHKRPHNEFEEFKNCYLVGGGTHPGSGLPTIYESGKISSRIILKKDGLL